MAAGTTPRPPTRLPEVSAGGEPGNTRTASSPARAPGSPAPPVVPSVSSPRPGEAGETLAWCGGPPAACRTGPRPPAQRAGHARRPAGHPPGPLGRTGIAPGYRQGPPGRRAGRAASSTAPHRSASGHLDARARARARPRPPAPASASARADERPARRRADGVRIVRARGERPVAGAVRSVAVARPVGAGTFGAAAVTGAAGAFAVRAVHRWAPEAISRVRNRWSAFPPA